MRPAQIRVFDGLRLTTEHVNHLQDALRSSVEDLREIAGLGVVQRGFDVSAADDQSIVVQPGLAFDFHKNRVVFDEPRTVPVAFGRGEDSQFVCVEYEQAEDGKVEDQFTLIWDSGSVVLRPALPEPADNLIAIAELSKAPDGSFTIARLPRPGTETVTGAAGSVESDPLAGPAHELPGDTAAATPPATPPAAGAPGASQNGAAASPGTGAPAALPTGTVPGVTEADGLTSTVEAASSDTSIAAATTEPSGPAEVQSPPLEPARLLVRQGLERLGGEPGRGTDLAALLIEPLRNTLAAKGRATTELRLSLFDKEVAVGFPVVSLSCHAIVSATIGRTESLRMTPTSLPVAANVGPAIPGAGALAPTRSSVVAQGEATFDASGVSQFGFSAMQSTRGDRATCEAMEDGIVHLVFACQADGAPEPATMDAIVQHLRLVIRVGAGVPDGYRLIGNLQWIGDVSADTVTGVEAHKPILSWNGVFGWKAMGTV